MHRQKAMVTATAGVGLIAATIYAVGLRPNQSLEVRNRSLQKSLDGSTPTRSAAGWKSTASRNDEQGLHETRSISKMGPETPSKRGPAEASEETK
ncbi:GPCR, family 2-like protein [Metarhizium robertsii ARSEF 23]|uniref:GPCR, family 2-like protein n=1 Tax=Metarhizium robertsii (strain ARSEF 23 / ATCC MYA-3075) TaxID=655844 RepID=A0A0B2XIY7_METRA|nr:GPCR, family 2-like protein [Metarhizium robertsii ARSEF 23]KHO11462.1 GPCR, family 2-like protein [Metarhizium robertsii ARSEF 23]